jgi:predicted  nucleic acid-binding Zn-ribbon protein
MDPSLEHLIRLQELDDGLARRRQTVAALPERLAACDAQVGTAEATLAAARERTTENETARRGFERDLAAAQSRLSRYKDQLMEVKTNREYHAMQHEIETVQGEVRTLEDRLLELLVSHDELVASVTAAEAGLADARSFAERERAARTDEAARMEAEIGAAEAERARHVADIDPQALALYTRVAERRQGQALAEARDGHCTACHVRLRLVIYQDARRGVRPVQCESCSRILYVRAPTPATEPASQQ